MNDFIHTIKNSLQARLSLALTAATLLLAAAAGGFSFYATYQETEELQDDLLRQTAAHISPASGHMAELPESDNDAHIFVQLLGSDGRFDIPAHLSDGFHNLTDDDDNYRAYLHRTDQGQIAVIQESEYREDLAENAAWRSTLPLLLSIPLSVALTVWIAHRTMRPVKKLSRSLGQRQDNDLSPLATDDVPSEITGFVTAINRLLERTQENMRQQQRFIADAAHELRSPMTALSLQAERLNSMSLPPEAQQQSAVLQQSISRNRHLLEQLLSFARAQTLEVQRPKSLISLQTLFRRTIETLLPLATAKNQDIGAAVETEYEIWADDTEIFTLVKTLADNAVRYTPEGGRIDLGFDETATHLVLWVEDNGNGIPAAERSRVLDPFYRILGTEQQGTGLGFPIAEAIAKRYGGRLVLTDSRQFAHGLLVKAELDKKRLQR